MKVPLNMKGLDTGFPYNCINSIELAAAYLIQPSVRIDRPACMCCFNQYTVSTCVRH